MPRAGGRVSRIEREKSTASREIDRPEPDAWRLDRRELIALIVGLAACLLLWGFIALAGEVMEGDTQALDTQILQSLRDPDDPARPRGPSWLEPALLDLTAIGGPTVLGLVVISVVGFLLLQGR